MPDKREGSSMLNSRQYNINGNALVAYYDEGKLVFVVDSTVSDIKPNVLLVINPDGNRKWDDILENDYAVDLETVRPKKDNKYQKLDIEYSGLSVYDSLIAAYDAGDDVSAEAEMLDQFRMIVARRVATERLKSAEFTAENARETIDRTDDAIYELQDKIKQLRAKLATHRKGIGKEPTKQSAAKILRAESQIDATNEKLRRARKRLVSAQKRLVAAEDDAEAAREVLARLKDIPENVIVPAVAPVNPVMEVAKEPQPLSDVQFTPVFSDFEEDDKSDIMEDEEEPVAEEEIEFTEPKAEPMADEEVKPLFDKDPEILDEEIAFKPIDFNVPAGVAPAAQPVAPVEPAQPVSFVPPVASQAIEDIPMAPAVEPVVPSAPVMPTPAPAPVVDVMTPVQPMPVAEAPVMTPAPMPEAVPMPEVAPIASPVRPVSPITGMAVAEGAKTERTKPGKMYYFLLVLLIVLSIFTLWLYQKNTGGNSVPELLPSAEPEVVVEEEPVVQPEPVIEPAPVVQSAPVAEEVKVPTAPIIEPEPIEIEAEPVVVEPVEQVIPVTVPVKTVVAEPVVQPEESPFIEPIEDPVAEKPEYNVSQNENMFVAAADYVSDRLANLEPVGVSGADVVVSQPETVEIQAETTVIEPEPMAPVIQEENIEVADAPVDGACANGGAPDQFGCCPGESYTQIENGGYVCCPDDGGDCFPPL